MNFKDGLTIFYLTVGIGGIMGGILTKINKIRFVSKKEFKEKQAECQTNLCGKIDTVKETLNGMKATVETNAKEAQIRRENDKKELNENLLKIATFIGGVEQFMKKNNKGG